MRRVLDDPDLYTSLDPSGMRERLMGAAAQCRRAAQLAKDLQLPPECRGPSSVVIAGMGTSAVSGDLAGALTAQGASSAPLLVWRSWGVPAWAGPKTLVVACSYSGTTQETLSAFQAAVQRKLPAVAVTRGGTLGQHARTRGIPVVPLEDVGEARVALAPTLVTLLGVLRAAGLLPDLTDQVEEAASLLESLAVRYTPEQPEEGNPAKALARALWGRVPVVYGGGLFAPVATAWKNSFNENSKSWALADSLPELTHNTVVGYLHPAWLRQSAVSVLLRSPLLPEELQKRLQLTAGLLKEVGVTHRWIDAEGGTALSQQLGLVYLGSWASYYLGLLYGVDPSPIPAVQLMKGAFGPAS